jgi:hypothetical protein
MVWLLDFSMHLAHVVPWTFIVCVLLYVLLPVHLVGENFRAHSLMVAKLWDMAAAGKLTDGDQLAFSRQK